MRILLFTFLFSVFSFSVKSQVRIPLNGNWQVGINRNYTSKAQVPSVLFDPALMNDTTIWYQKQIRLPKGGWKYGTLELKGARFCPEVYINKTKVSVQNGGMAPTFHFLGKNTLVPGGSANLEIALKSLKNVSPTDASYIPVADHWRSNVSSYLWDDVVLHLHGNVRIDRIIPFTNFSEQSVDVRFSLSNFNLKAPERVRVKCQITDLEGNPIHQIEREFDAMQWSDSLLQRSLKISLGNKIKDWTPDNPNLYLLKISVWENKLLLDEQTIHYALKDFQVKSKQFYLNNNPFKSRAATVVWHRWTRDTEGRELAYDTVWFKKNVIKPMKDRGANTLRFHLGNPPERFLDMCDRYGLLVQYEWHFFHGMTASKESLKQQWKQWLDLAMRHPSVSIIHPYNETEGPELETAWDALNELTTDYPPMVISDRDVLHIHKYWWSLFENLGLYYDSFEQFPLAIMVDEFGGNYLDGNGDMGGYKTVKETYLRFLGRDHTKEMRLKHHTISNSQIAEYWRRIGAAGFSPFCVLGSHEDGSHWYLGKQKDGELKPVWNALTAAWSPVSVSLNIWDRHFTPGQTIEVPVYLFNDTKEEYNANITISIVDESGKNYGRISFTEEIGAYSKIVTLKVIQMPDLQGVYTIKAELENPPSEVKYPVISQWDFRVFKRSIPEQLTTIQVGIPSEEKELKDFLISNKIKTVAINDYKSDAIVVADKTWAKIAKGDTALLNLFSRAIDNGISVVLLDVGPFELGQGYPTDPGDLGPLKGASVIKNPTTSWFNLCKGLKVGFKEAAEPESHIHSTFSGNALWKKLLPSDTWLFNGLRGGVVVPAAELSLSGLTRDAFIDLWVTRGASKNELIAGKYYAYELQGFFEFSTRNEDAIAIQKLRERVKFLVDDAPALAGSLSPDGPVTVTDLNQGLLDTRNALAKSFIPMATCGKGLSRFPVYVIGFGEGKGKIIISQLITRGRLTHESGRKGFYDLRYDEVAAQLVLNMIQIATDANFLNDNKK